MNQVGTSYSTRSVLCPLFATSYKLFIYTLHYDASYLLSQRFMLDEYTYTLYTL